MIKPDSKKLNIHKRELKEELNLIRDKKYSLIKLEKLKQEEIEKINKKLDKIRNGKMIVTDHAMIRYMQRIKNLDVEDLQKLVVPPETAKLINKFKSGKFPAGTHHVIVANKIVKTIIKKL